ncbi:restriction endonuclease [Halomonas sp. Choline-3u-9]|nr:restriction endonuclease [Halomonas sp. Choline-3u-9]
MISLPEICRPKQWPTVPKSQMLESGFPVYGANGKIGYFSTYNHEYPTILITCRGATCGTINVCEPKSYVTGNAMALDELDSSRVDLRFLSRVLESADFGKVITGVAQPQITRQTLSRLQFPLPPLAEQKRIAAILDAADDLRAKRRDALAQLDSFLQSTFIDMFGDPITNPMEWDMGVIGDLLASANYGTSKKASQDEGQYPVLRMNNITYTGEWDFRSIKFIDLDEKELLKHLVHNGQILFNRTNSKEMVGKTAVYRRKEPMAFAGYLVRGVVNDSADPEYIGAFMNTPQMKLYLQSKCKSIVGMANINAKEFQAIPIPKPPVKLQRSFASIVESVEQQKSRMRAHLAELDALFASLQHRAFNGEL